MDHAGIGALPHLVAQNFGGIIFGIAGVDDDRQSGFARCDDVTAKARALTVTVAVVVIIIEAAFADPHYARMRGTANQFCGVDIGMLVGFVRVDAHRRPHIGLTLCDCQHVVPLALARGDVEHRGHAGGTGRRQHFVLPLGKALIVQVAMAIG